MIVQKLRKLSSPFCLGFSCWLIAIVASLASLFFSEVMEFVPCVLCWYQRIAMYPLVFIFLISGLRSGFKDRELYLYSFPLIILGWLISLYHNLLHYELIPESASPCLQGVPCSTVYINLFGFITIPLLSFTAFSLLLAISLIALQKKISKVNR